MSKRGPDDQTSGSGQPPIKKVHFEPHLIGSVSTLEEMDIKVLKFQHKKLAQVQHSHSWNLSRQFPIILLLIIRSA